MTALDQFSPLPDAARVQPVYEAPQHVPPSRALTVLRRRKWLVAAVVLCLSVPAWFFIAGLKPYFETEASILIDTRKNAFSDLQAVAANTTSESLALRTQLDIIRSYTISGKVVDRLDLVHAPEFQRVLDAEPSLVQQARQRLMALFVERQPGRPLTAAERRQITINLLQGKLTVGNDGRSYIIAVRVRTNDPELGARIADAYADIYLDFNREVKTAAIARGNALLDAQIAPLRGRVREAENLVERFREQNGLVLNRTGDSQAGQGGGGTVADQQLAQVNAQLTAASGDLAQKEANLRAVQAAQRAGGGLHAVPEVVASPLIQRLREQEVQLSGREASLNQTALSNNPAVQATRAALADVRRRIDAEIAKTVASLTNEVNAAKARRDALQQSLARLQVQVTGQSQAAVMLRQLESEAEAARTVYRDFLGRYEQTSNQAALQEPEATLLSAAQVPLGPSGPPRLQLSVLAGVVSLVAGGLLALVVERLKGGIRTAEQLEAETGLYPIGFVPSISAPRRALMQARPSIYTQSVNLARSVLQHGDDPVRAGVVLVTSASPKEGKTTFSVSLAASVGRGGGRALLVDCDVHRPSVASVLGLGDAPPSRPADGAADGVAQQGVLRRNALPGLDVLTFVPRHSGQLSSIGPDRMRDLLVEARERYDMVVLDMPPVLAFADAPVLAPVTDGVVVVVRWGHTPAASVLGALRVLRAYGGRVLGGVLTQVRTSELTQSEGTNASIYRNYAEYFR